MPLSDYQVLTFDCYGTLIDWETGIAEALAGLVAASGEAFTRDQVLEAHARHEAALETENPALPYSKVLARVYKRIAREWGVEAEPEDALAYGRSVQDWPAFPDSAAALRVLQRHYKLAILSNVDRESFAASKARLQVVFDYVYTAEEIGSYKPDVRNFDYLLEHLAAEGFPRQRVLHVAESLYHDHVPANRVGLASAWIHRRSGQEGHGATHPPERMPTYDYRFTSLAELAEACRTEP